MLGAALGATLAAAAALLLYTTSGFLGTAGFLISLALVALALGVWAGAERVPRRWLGLIVAYLLAASFATLWARQPTLRQSALGGALAVLFLIAEPAYATGTAYPALTRGERGAGVAVLLGAATGVLLAALLLIPRLQPAIIFGAAAVVLLSAALIDRTRAPRQMSANDFSLNGKRAIVTGVGDRGQVGFAVAQALIGAGARTVITGFSGDLNALAAELGAGTLGVQADLLNEDDIARLTVTAIDHLGGIDILVNVAGGLRVNKPVAETSAAEWQGEIARNAESAFLVSRATLPHLRATRGAIVNFASPAGERAVARLSAYSAAKAAVIALTRALAIEEKPNGVRVNAVAPGMIDTEQNRQAMPAGAKVKWVTRQQVASAVLFLASDAAAGISGETIHVLGEGV